MKPEQIAKLRAMENRPDRPCGTFDGATYRLSMPSEMAREVDLALWSVPQLLDEREALLAALRRASLHVDSHCIIPAVHTPICKSLRAAIMKAES